MKHILDNTKIKSPLESHSVLNPKAGNSKRSLVSALILTSLVDAFSILVIYLLVTTTGGNEQVKISGKVNLPTAATSDLAGQSLTIRIQNKQFSIDDKVLNLNQVMDYLLAQTNSKDAAKSILIEADKSMSFETLSPVLMAAGKAGFVKVQFAVMQEGS